jgi:predicted Zn-dependent protease with MMP-like domain
MPSGQSGTREDFEAAAQAIWDGLPEQFRAVLSNVTVHVADFADAETLKAMHISDPYALLGLYHGVGLPFKSVLDPASLPDRIFLYRIPILVPSLDEFNDLITRAGSGAEFRLDIWRQGTKLTLPVRLGSASEETKAGSIEQRIDAYDAIAKIFDRNAFPTLWATTENKLGIAYWARVQGSRAENIEAAIKAYQAALTVLPREALPQEPAAENVGSAQMEAAAKSEAQPSEEKAQPASQPVEASSPAPTETTSIPPLVSRTPSASATAFSAPPLKAVDKQSPGVGTVRHRRYGYWHRPYRRHYGYWHRPYYRRWVYGYRHYGYRLYGYRRW